MENDDRPVGRIWGRREVLALFSAAGAGAIVTACGGGSGDVATRSPAATGTAAGNATETTAGATTAAATATEPAQAAATATATPVAINCVVTPALTEGPYFVDEKLERSDIRSDPGTGEIATGALLRLGFNVYEVNGAACAPIEGAMVDAWHCDALGVYSDAIDPGFNTRGQKFLRGFQRTDASGHAGFTTIYPGWYQGRAVHIHFKVRGTNATGQAYEFTSQLFFDEATTDIVHARQPYAAKGYRTLLNDGDGIYRSSGGQTLIDVRQDGEGWAGTFNIGMRI
jgi:protocatechuate 3,4-dioxygenase beta subunit